MPGLKNLENPALQQIFYKDKGDRFIVRVCWYQWWASYFYKATELLYFRYWWKKLATFIRYPFSRVGVPLQLLVTGILNVIVTIYNKKLTSYVAELILRDIYR